MAETENAVAAVPALSGAIFAINTWLHPDASDAKNITWLENNATAIITRLAALRTWCTAQGDDLPDAITGADDKPHRHEAPGGGQALLHAHYHDGPHGYFGHAEDPLPHEPSETTGTYMEAP